MDYAIYKGFKYRFSDGYYRRNNQKGGHRFLHRHVWEDHHGPLPDGYVIHHVDHNTKNNAIENLVAITQPEHLSHHSKELWAGLSPEQKAQRIAKSTAWTKTEEGKLKLAETNAKNRLDGKYDGQDKTSFYAARDAWIKTDEWREICRQTTLRRLKEGDLTAPSDDALRKAAEWHGSEEGKAWHREHAKQIWKNRKPQKKQCQHCGKEYETLAPSRSKFCHPNCKMADLRNRRKRD